VPVFRDAVNVNDPLPFPDPGVTPVNQYDPKHDHATVHDVFDDTGTCTCPPAPGTTTGDADTDNDGVTDAGVTPS